MKTSTTQTKTTAINGEKSFLGKFEDTSYGVSGVAYIVGSNKILIEDFSYDARGPDAFFLVGTKGTNYLFICCCY